MFAAINTFIARAATLVLFGSRAFLYPIDVATWCFLCHLNSGVVTPCYGGNSHNAPLRKVLIDGKCGTAFLFAAQNDQNISQNVKINNTSNGRTTFRQSSLYRSPQRVAVRLQSFNGLGEFQNPDAGVDSLRHCRQLRCTAAVRGLLRLRAVVRVLTTTIRGRRNGLSLSVNLLLSDNLIPCQFWKGITSTYVFLSDQRNQAKA